MRKKICIVKSNYYPDISGCDLEGANLALESFFLADLSYANLDGACLEAAIGFTQTNYYGTLILELHAVDVVQPSIIGAVVSLSHPIISIISRSFFI